MFDLSDKVPTDEELCECDSHDLSFLALTRHICFVDKFDLIFDIIKAVKDEALWDPEADLMAVIMEKAWKKHGKRLTDDLIAAFDLSNDISVNVKAINVAFKKHKNAGKKVWKEVGKKIAAVLTDTGQRSTRYFEKQQRKVLRKKQATAEDWSRYTQEALSDHVRAFTEEYPERVLHPAVENLVKITEKDPLQRLIARSELKQRIEAIGRMPANYLKNATDVQAGRMWTYTGIQMAHAQQVTEYIVIAQRDRRTCLVCQRLDGKTFSVVQAHERMIEHLSALCPGKGKAEVPEYCGFFEEAKRLPPLVKWMPAKTVKEAEKWALRNIQGLEKVSWGRFSAGQANSINSELSVLQNKYGRLGRLSRIEIKNKSFGFAGRMRGARVLEIREDITDDFLTGLHKAGVDGFTTVKPGLAGLVDHEIGHTMTPNIFDVSKPSAPFTAFGRRLDKFFEANKDRIRKEMGEYTASARHEFVAEAFAMREAGTASKWVNAWLVSEGI